MQILRTRRQASQVSQSETSEEREEQDRRDRWDLHTSPQSLTSCQAGVWRGGDDDSGGRHWVGVGLGQWWGLAAWAGLSVLRPLHPHHTDHTRHPLHLPGLRLRGPGRRGGLWTWRHGCRSWLWGLWILKWSKHNFHCFFSFNQTPISFISRTFIVKIWHQNECWLFFLPRNRKMQFSEFSVFVLWYDNVG